MFRTILNVTLILLFACVAISAQRPTQTPVSETKANARPTPPPEQVSAEPFDKADVKTMASRCVQFDTEAGVIEMEMFPESAPESVRNFLNLTAIGAFDNTTFSRVVPGFVIQGGDLYTSGKITPQLAVRARRPVPDEPNTILHERGILSMARSDKSNSATTHFFILVDTASNLDGTFAAFGHVTKGMEFVDAINKANVSNEKPDKPVKIKKASVFECSAQ